MEMELEPSVKPLTYKVKGMSRESPSQKALHVLDTDLRSHWSTGTNTKEWILIELDEPALLSHIRIYNKSVLEWEISVGLRYKPEAFVKVRPRCEAPRRDMMYPMNYTPCRYVRISCLRGNPIAIFFIQLIGVSMVGLEPEFQPVINHLLPHIISHKQDVKNRHLQLLQDITSRLLMFLPQLEADLSGFSEAAETSIRFLAMLAGPFYPILHIVSERDISRTSSCSDSDASRNNQALTLTVSSNFEVQPRRSRCTSPFLLPASGSVVYRPDVVFMLLRKAYKDPHLKNVCLMASRVLQKAMGSALSLEASIPSNEMISSVSDEALKADTSNCVVLSDYSKLFGEEFTLPDDHWDSKDLNVIDVGAVEEGILHVLYACASQPLLCVKLADYSSDFWSVLPMVQALLPALRPSVSSSSDQVDDSFTQWKHPLVQHALSQIVATLSSSVFRPLLNACAGYLSSFSPSHVKAASVLIDLCSGPLAPWIAQVVAKVDLTIELLEDLLGTIQGARHSITRARAALKYIILALSGHMDDILAKYKEVKHKILFLVEMLEPFLDPAITAMRNTIAFGDVSTVFLEKQERTCAIALNVIRTAVQKPAVLPSLESEWRRGSVAPSVLLSILGPHMQLPPEIDLCKCSVSKIAEQESSNASSVGAFFHLGGPSSNLNSQDESDGKIEASEAFMKMDVFDDASLLFAPSELKVLTLGNISTFSEGISPDKISSESSHLDVTTEGKHVVEKNPAKPLQGGLILDVGFPAEYFNLQADYLQLMNHCDCELRASEFQHLASDLHSQHEITSEGHDAAIDALLLSAECYVNPFFLMSLRSSSKVINQMSFNRGKIPRKYEISELRRAYERNNVNFEMIAHLERKRDKTILLILIEAAELDKKYKKNISHGKQCPYDNEGHEQGLKLSAPDTHSADAVTLVRQNQSLLCNFLIQQFQREQHPMHEILMQSLLFLLHSATELVCPPERVIDIILGSAEYLNGLLTSFYHQLKEGNLQLDPEKVHAVQRRWVILQRLVIASSGGGEWQDSAFSVNNGLQYRSLIPLSSWMQRIPTFSSCELPLVRFLGWMAICRYAKQYIKAQLTLASDLSQLTCLLSIFADELAVVDNIINQKDGTPKLEQLRVKQNLETDRGFENSDQSLDAEYFHVIYPDMNKFFPNLKMQFERFGEVILEAVGLQLRNLPSSAVPDVLCWFSELCLYPFLQNEKIQHSYGNGYDNLKGYAAKNAKAIILYILEAIVVEHMEAMVPETPKVVQVLAALCKASYCDVPFLNSILHLLKPLISYSLRKVSADENLLIDESCCLNFESLCFEELFNNIRQIKEYQDGCTDIINNGALTIFVLGFLFPDLSFTRRMELLKSLTLWADFATFEPTSSFSDYLCAFQIVMESCDVILIQTLEVLGIFFSAQKSHSLGLVTISDCDGNPKSYSGFVSDVCESSLPSTVDGNVGSAKNGAVAMSKKNYALSTEEIEDFSKFLDSLISNLSPTVELCWNLHHQLAKKLTLTSAKCLMYSRCLLSIKNKFSTNGDGETENLFPSTSNSNVSIHWRFVLEGLVKLVIELQQKHSWQVASVMFDNLLAMPHFICLEDVIGTICSAIKEFCCHAPKISWRVQSDKWLSILLRRSIHGLHEDEGASFADMFCKMLGHPEPEQRSIALQHLRRLASQDLTVGTTKSSSTVCDELGASDIANSVPEQVLSLLVSHTWDAVAMLASFEPSMLLRANAMAVLVDFVPFAKRSQLQSFLGAADRVLCGLGNTSYLTCEGPLTRLSLALLASACLYSSAEDISLIPQSVWRNIEALGMSNAGSLGDLEKKASRALCKLRAEGDSAKEILKEAISSSSVPKESDPDFGSTRDSILQVLANLTSVQSYFDVFTKKIDQEAMEIEEAELEMEILQKEQLLQEPSGDSKQWKQIPLLSTCTKDDNRLQQIKDGICSLEKSKLREEIVARRQKRLIAREARQKYLEEAAMQEAELLQELDRERTAEKEREIERQHLLEFERSKTRELRHNLDMEKERLTQRELQWELEQAESGFRPSRRETSSSTSSSRARERYRERDNGRLGNEGSLRPSSRGRESGSRPFSGQPPTILQPRDRLEERGSSYEENFEGSKDSGDTSSIGDTELPSTMDGQAGGFGTAQRHGSRGSKSRQTMERRERDGRREGKWERKH